MADSQLKSAFDKEADNDYKTRFGNLIQARHEFVKKAPVFCKGLGMENYFILAANHETYDELGMDVKESYGLEREAIATTGAGTFLVGVADGFCSSNFAWASLGGGVTIAVFGILAAFGGDQAITALEQMDADHNRHIVDVLDGNIESVTDRESGL